MQEPTPNQTAYSCRVIHQNESKCRHANMLEQTQHTNCNFYTLKKHTAHKLYNVRNGTTKDFVVKPKRMRIEL